MEVKGTIGMRLVAFDSYDDYVRAQTSTNLRKQERVWISKSVIRFITKFVKRYVSEPRLGICHGVRNGHEVWALADHLPGVEIVGTEIAAGCEQFEGVVRHDFHEPRAEWVGAAGFVYTNSLDHAYDPYKAVNCWMDQLQPGGALMVEWSQSHAGRVNLADCFAAGLDEYWTLLEGFGPVRCRKLKAGNCAYVFTVQKPIPLAPPPPEAKES